MKHAINLSIFLILAITAWWSITADYNNTRQLQQDENKVYAEIFMNEFEMTAMNENGKPHYILNGLHLQRYSNSDNTEIKQPVFQLLQENKQWKVSANKALINDKNETLQLIDNVVMQQQNTESAITIRTQNLSINTNTQITQTQAPVDITRGKSRIKSNGMIFNNITSELELSSNVTGYYLPL
ncbi:MAG: LPS export ABC transporter periplasmic protein LptC [Gammaproteobacteria bacterium]|nr:LPS export ABC transporter periplasmic protein LptC [Gammaproteobacteria bacterium]NOQ69357.1 LPS export ABC transporter periplasmic protein LptC [Gammaproteobacteria bacterium]